MKVWVIIIEFFFFQTNLTLKYYLFLEWHVFILNFTFKVQIF